MPKSKSKRKAVIERERAVRASQVREASGRKSADIAYERLRQAYAIPFHREHPDDEYAGFIIDLLFEHTFTWSPGEGGRLLPIREAALVEIFCEPVEDMFEYAPADANAAFERLVALGMIERVDGLVCAILPSGPTV